MDNSNESGKINHLYFILFFFLPFLNHIQKKKTCVLFFPHINCVAFCENYPSPQYIYIY